MTESRRPNFALVGAPRAGTTSIVRWIETHPRVFVTDPKEPFYFADEYPNLRALQGVATEAAYRELFRRAGSQHQAVGEASTLYLSSSTAIARFNEFADRARVIVALRDPAELAVSFHGQMALQGFDERPFDVAWRQPAHAAEPMTRRCPDDSLLDYRRIMALGDQVTRVLAVLDDDQVLVVLLDELRRDPRGEYLRILGHLGVADDGRVDFPRQNASRVARGPVPALLRRARPRGVLRAAKRRLPVDVVERLRAVRDVTLFRVAPPPTLADDVVASVREVAHEQVKILDRLLGLGLASRWGYAS